VQIVVLKSHLPTAELEEDVDVFLVFEVMGEFHHMLVRQGFVELDLVGDLFRFDSQSVLCAYFNSRHDSRWRIQVVQGEEEGGGLSARRKQARSRTLSRWWGLDTRLWGITLTAYILLLERSVIS